MGACLSIIDPVGQQVKREEEARYQQQQQGGYQQHQHAYPQQQGGYQQQPPPPQPYQQHGYQQPPPAQPYQQPPPAQPYQQAPPPAQPYQQPPPAQPYQQAPPPPAQPYQQLGFHQPPAQALQPPPPPPSYAGPHTSVQTYQNYTPPNPGQEMGQPNWAYQIGVIPQAQAPPPHYHVPQAPPQMMQQWAPQRKKALLVGINYRDTPGARLNGCINDVKCMKYMLMKHFEYKEEDIVMLTDDERRPEFRPTKYNILQAFHWLVNGCSYGDSLFFQFSGHGSQKRDHSGQEADGLNEVLLPCDFERGGYLVDDEINAYLVRPLGPGVRLHAVVDACHSGTAMDLDYTAVVRHDGWAHWLSEEEQSQYRMGRMGGFGGGGGMAGGGLVGGLMGLLMGMDTMDDGYYGNQGPEFKGTSGGECILFSGSRDDQTSADTSALSGVTSTGAMSFCFIQAVEQGHAATYNTLLRAIRWSLVNGPSHFDQVPQLSSSWQFDLNRPFSM